MFGNLVANPRDATAAASCIRQNTRHRAAAVETHDDSIVFFASGGVLRGVSPLRYLLAYRTGSARAIIKGTLICRRQARIAHRDAGTLNRRQHRVWP
jgi:hypothetical protein